MFHRYGRRRGFGFGPHRRWEDFEPPPDWPFGRFGFGFGRRGWRGFGGPGERLFGRGDLKYVILELLRDQPRHGYDIIRALEDRFRGMYRPSPGSVYPTLQMLEDLGYVTSSQQDGKKTYAITDEGRQYLAAEQSTIDDIRSRIMSGWEAASRPEVSDVMHELRQLARALFRQATDGALQDPDRLRQLRDIVQRARAEVDAVHASASAPPPPPPPPSSAGPTQVV